MKKILSLLLGALILGGCIRNDIPYPNIVAAITSLEVEGAVSVTIKAESRVVDVVLGEAVNVRDVNIRNISFNNPKVKPSWDVTGHRDLSSSLKLTLSVYSDFVWEIRATQPIERSFTVLGQIGESSIDVSNRRAIAQVSSKTNKKSIVITSLKLGPETISSYQPAAAEIHDFTSGAQVQLSYRDQTEIWQLFVEQVETSVTLDRVDVWTKIAWLKASGVAGQSNGFRWRKAGETDWNEVADVQTDGGSFEAVLRSLEPETEYECLAYSGKEETEVKTFTTGSEVPAPNGGFETFSNVESSKFYSFYDPSSPETALQTKWWGSGNKGSTTVGSNYAITLPEPADKVQGNYSVKLASAYVVIKFAAGNIFSGEYYKTIGTSGGVIRLGRPFTQRPQKLSVWVKYHSGIIPEKCMNGAPEGDNVKVGDNDRAVVWVALGDWDYRKYGGSADSPVEINTTDKSTFFDPKGENVIAYGSFVTAKDIDEWTKIEIPLEYNSVSRKPTHIIISAAASMLGDYFTGSPDSVLLLDDMRLEY